MIVLSVSLALFISAFIFHLIIWRIAKPKKQTKALIKIFLGTLLTGLALIYWFPSFFISEGVSISTTFFGYFHITLLFISLTLAYITTYSGMEVDSPSLVMIQKIAEKGTEGLCEKKFYDALTDNILVKPRVFDLIRDEMAYLKDEKYIITPKGARLARIFLFYRKLLNVTVKGG